MGLAGTGAAAPLPSRGTDLSYRGFRLRQQRNLGWQVEPHTSQQPGGFSTPPSSLADVKALIDWRLDQAA
jgi:hypothetical protein